MSRRKRRANGEGSVYQRSSDGKWCAAIVLPDGKRKVVYGKTRQEALAERRKLLRELDEGVPVSPRQPPKLADWVEREWVGKSLPARVAGGTMSPETLDSYRDNWRLHIAPTLGAIRIDRLSPAAIRRWQTELLAKPSAYQPKPKAGEPDPPIRTLSARTVAYCHAILRAALNDALQDEVPGLRRNVVALVEPPKVRGRKGTALTVEQLTTVLAVIDQDSLRVLWLTLLGLGLRRGEALALRWSRIDLDKSTVKIAKSLRRRRTDELRPSGQRRGKLVEGDTKTDDSEATLAIPEPLVAVLREHQRDQRKARMAAEIWVDPDLVFTTGHGTPIEPRNVNRAWERVLTKAGIPHAHVHDLRHTMATLMVRQKVDLKIVQRALRHSRHSTTADLYAHVLDDMQRAGADELAKALRELGIGG